MNKKQVIKRIRELDWSKEHRPSGSKKQPMSLGSNKVEFVVFDITDGNSGLFPKLEFVSENVNDLVDYLAGLSLKCKISFIKNCWSYEGFHTYKLGPNSTFARTYTAKTIINIKESDDFTTNIDADVLDAFVKLGVSLEK